MRILVGLLGVPGLPCLNPAAPGVLEEVVGVGAVLRFSKSTGAPSGVFTETVTAFLGTNDDEVAFRVLVGGFHQGKPTDGREVEVEWRHEQGWGEYVAASVSKAPREHWHSGVMRGVALVEGVGVEDVLAWA